MPQYQRVGHEFTMEFSEPPNPDFWEPVTEAPAEVPPTEPPAAPVPEGA